MMKTKKKRKKHAREVLCGYGCGKTFPTNGEYNRHIKQAHLEKYLEYKGGANAKT